MGDNPFDLTESGGAGAIWVKTISKQSGQISVTATHSALGKKTVAINVLPAFPAKISIKSNLWLAGTLLKCYFRGVSIITAKQLHQETKAVLNQLEQGESLLITRNGRTIGRIEPVAAAKAGQLAGHHGRSLARAKKRQIERACSQPGHRNGNDNACGDGNLR